MLLTIAFSGCNKQIELPRELRRWSIGIYTGESPFNFISPENVVNPVLTAKDVTDVSAFYVADPFMINENSTWYMFFEVVNIKTFQGDIGLAISNDGFNWTYKQIVLDEQFHLSYPYIFKWRNDYGNRKNCRCSILNGKRHKNN